jgi:uncharacterized repeat protein (TIGR03803 family)
MKDSAQHRKQTPNLSFRPPTAALAIAIVFALMVVTQSAQAQTFTLLHTFTGPDGADPAAGLAMDRAGRLYGTTVYGGGGPGLGIVFQLSRKGTGWIFNHLYTFNGNATNDGARPFAGLTIGPDGSFYGTTHEGGGACSLTNHGCGTVYNLKPPASACKTALCPWAETVIYRFAGGSDGAAPGYGNLVFDQAGNIYGTTTKGGVGGGTVFELTPSNDGWTESVLYGFRGGDDGGVPWGALVLDKGGNLYGTTYNGGGKACSGEGCGTVFELTPSGSGWTETILYSFQGGSDGGFPYAGLVFDQSGNLYGATLYDGSGQGGTVFELTPSNGTWAFNLLYSLSSFQGPYNSLVFDAAGNLYGTAAQDDGAGLVFELTPEAAAGPIPLFISSLMVTTGHFQLVAR